MGAQSFAEVLGEELGEAGEPPILSLTVIETPGTVTIGGAEEFNMQAGTDPWQDEDTRTFYTSLPDLKVFMPNYQPKEVRRNIFGFIAIFTTNCINIECGVACN